MADKRPSDSTLTRPTTTDLTKIWVPVDEEGTSGKQQSMNLALIATKIGEGSALQYNDDFNI